MGAKYLSYEKFIATEAPKFFGYIISVLASMSITVLQFNVGIYKFKIFLDGLMCGNH